MAKTQFREVSLSALEDEWQRMATAAAIASARKIIGPGSCINPNVKIGTLSDIEWGWILAAMLFAWIRTRSEQATAEGLDTEQLLRQTVHQESAWDAGTVAVILPELGNLPDIDWSLPVTSWPQEMIIKFLLAALELVQKAKLARDLGARGVSRHSSVDAEQ